MYFRMSRMGPHHGEDALEHHCLPVDLCIPGAQGHADHSCTISACPEEMIPYENTCEMRRACVSIRITHTAL